jgi:REP element-mobilizing transposase RayT
MPSIGRAMPPCDADRMARPLRIEFPGAIYHVTSRGNRCESVFLDDRDRSMLLGIIGEALGRFKARMLAYCLMGNHFHFVLQTELANLSRVMRHINGVYTQAFNARHDRVGHVLQGRYGAILVDSDAYLLEVSRYVELNPVRAGMVAGPEDWPWSSYRAHVGMAAPPCWLATERLLAHVHGRALGDRADAQEARLRYAELVRGGMGARLWETGLRQQMYLGGDEFIERMQARATPGRLQSTGIPVVQRSSPWTLDQWRQHSSTLADAVTGAYRESGLTMTFIASCLGVSVSTVSRMIRAREANGAAGSHERPNGGPGPSPHAKRAKWET